MKDEILNRNNNINRQFRKLDVWKEAVDLYVLVKEKVRPLQLVPPFIKAEVEDTVFNCHSNIARGHSQANLKDFINCIDSALISLGENYGLMYALAETMDVDYPWFDMYDEKLYSLENKIIELMRELLEKAGENSELKQDPRISELRNKYFPPIP